MIIFKSIYHVPNLLGGVSIVNIRCDDYGFDCDYFREGVIEEIVDDYWDHMNNEHGIEYSKETIYESIQKKYH